MTQLNGFSNEIQTYHEAVRNFDHLDVFNEHIYLSLDAEHSGDKFVYYYDLGPNYSLVIPLKIRSFSKNGVTVYDLTMAYGYPTPILTIKNKSHLEGLRQQILDRFKVLAACNGFLAVFLRFNPGLKSCSAFELFKPMCRAGGEVVLLDLSQDEKTRLSHYRKVHRREISKAKNLGVSVFIDRFKPEHVEDFCNTYRNTMSMLSAEKFYYFDKQYFLGLTKLPVWLISTNLEGVPITQSLFTVQGRTMNYFLSCASDHSLRAYANKLAIHEAASLGVKLHCEVLNLGGGLGASRDGLFRFKKGFSDKVENVFFGNIVLDEKKYLKICDLAGINPEAVQFFPAYRSM